MSDAPVLLLHAGVCDRRMWDDVVPGLRDVGRKVVAPDLRGFGARPTGHAPFSHHRDVLALLDGLGIERADIVGASMGGHVAMEVAAIAPERVASLALLAPGIDPWEWSREVQEYGKAEEAALARGDVEGAIELNVRMWCPEAAPDVQAYVAEAQRRALELSEEAADEEELDPPVGERLGAITAETLVAVGDRDVSDFQAIARHLAATLPGPELRVVEGAGHLLPLERPDLISEVLAGWLRDR